MYIFLRKTFKVVFIHAHGLTDACMHSRTHTLTDVDTFVVVAVREIATDQDSEI